MKRTTAVLAGLLTVGLMLLLGQSTTHSVSTIGVSRGVTASRGMQVKGFAPVTNYTIECVRKGKVVWRETIHNVVTTQGATDVLDKYFKGSTYTATWYVGLIDNAGFTAVDVGNTAAKITTAANPPTTNGWQELSAYTEANRQTLTLGTPTAGSVDNSASKAAFSMNATNTVKGAFLDTNNTKTGGTSGILYSPAAFSGTKAVESGDTLNVTATITQALLEMFRFLFGPSLIPIEA